MVTEVGRGSPPALALVCAEFWVNIQPERAFYQMPARFWEMAAGGLVALSPAAGRRPSARWNGLALGLVVILLALGKFVGEVYRWWAVLATYLVATVVGALAYTAVP